MAQGVSEERTSAGVGETEIPEDLKMFGAVLQALRKSSRLTQEQLAPQLRYSPGYIAKLEQGKRFPPPDLPERVGQVLGGVAENVLKAAAQHLRRRSGIARRFQQWVAIEEEALTLFAYECRVVPGLLQPEPYMREVHSSHVPPLTDSQLETQVKARLTRQRLLTERGNTEFSFIIEQHVLERELGGAETTRSLIDHLLDCARLRNVELLIMPIRRVEHGGLNGPLYLAETPSREWLGYTEAHDCSYLFAEPNQVGTLLQRYGRMRGQALDSEASMALLEDMRGAP
ncbi:helix-turn-helix transcriptional regulator [Streptomyces sp. NPDC052644]